MMRVRKRGACLLFGLLMLLLAAPAQAVTLQTSPSPDVWGPLDNPLKTAEVRVVKGDGGFTAFQEVAIYNHDTGTSSGRTVAWNNATDPVYTYTLSRTGDTITFTWDDPYSNPAVSWSYNGFGNTLYDRFVFGAATSDPDSFNASMTFTQFKAWDQNGTLMERIATTTPWGAYTTSSYGLGHTDVYKMINSMSFDDGSGAVAFRDFEITGTFCFTGDLDAAYGDDLGLYFAFDKVNPTPLPAAVWLLGSGFIGLVGIRRRMKA